MKKIIAMLCCAAALTWAGCSDDDDTDKVDMSLLTGKWEVTKQYDGELDRWYENFGEASGFVQTIELRTDGTGTEKTIEIYQEQVYTYEYDFTYTVHGKTITMPTKRMRSIPPRATSRSSRRTNWSLPRATKAKTAEPTPIRSTSNGSADPPLCLDFSPGTRVMRPFAGRMELREGSVLLSSRHTGIVRSAASEIAPPGDRVVKRGRSPATC